MAKRKQLGAPLSPSERRVLAQVALGRTYPEVAAALGITLNTVKTHMLGIYDASGLRHRARVLEWARATGILSANAASSVALAGLPGDGLREFAEGFQPGVAALAGTSPQWRAGYAAAGMAWRRAALKRARELDKAAALTASEVGDA